MLAWLLFSAAALLFAQNEAGSLAGRLTDLHSRPVGGATVLLRNQATGREQRSATGKNGVYLFTALDPGLYTLIAESSALGHGELQDLSVAAGVQEHLQTAMDFHLSANPFSKSPSAPAPSLQAAALLKLHDWSEPREEPTPPPINILIPVNPPVAWTLPNRFLASGEPPQTASPQFAQFVEEEPSQGFVLPAESTLPVPASSQANTAPLPPALTAVPSAILTGNELRALPSTGRNWQTFLPNATAPGSAPIGSPILPAQTSFDGGSRTLAFPVQGSYSPESSNPANLSGSGASRPSLGEAAIRSVQAATGSAEAAGSHIQIETERGSNNWHGQGFLFNRSNLGSAQNPFTQWVKETAPATGIQIPVFTPQPYTPPDLETIWGFGLGHALRRDRIFWFAALDSYQRDDPGVAMVKHPCLEYDGTDCTTGFFAQPSSAQLSILGQRQSSVDPLTLYSGKLEQIATLLGKAPRTANQRLGFARIDAQATEREHWTLEGSGALWNSPGGGLSRTAEPYGLASFGSSHASEGWGLSRWEAYLSPNLLAVTQASFERAQLSAHAEAPSAFEQPFLKVNTWGQLPQIVIDSRYGLTTGNPARFGPGSYPDERLTQLRQQLDWAHSPLLLRMGFEFRHASDATSLLRNQTGTYTYSNIENFISDALAFDAYGIHPPANPLIQPYCDQTGTVWTDTKGTAKGYGALPCYSSYSQTLGPTHWWLSSNDWAGYLTLQVQPRKHLLLSAGLRWEREQTPPPFAELTNSELPQAGVLPVPGNQWGPRLSLAWGQDEGHWPLLRLGYGMYFGRTANTTLLTLLTNSGSMAGDLHFFLRPTDNLNQGGAPPFPAVLNGEPGSVVKPSLVEAAPAFRNPQIHQASATLEERLPAHIVLTASAELSLGRKLPVSIDTNIDPAVNPGSITYAVKDSTGQGPIQSAQLTVPFYATWAGSLCTSAAAANAYGQCDRLHSAYQQIDELFSRANSIWEAANLRIDRSAPKGLSLHARYTYSHAMDWNPNEQLSPEGASIFDPDRFGLEYGSSDQDMRQSAAVLALWQSPWKLRGPSGRLANGWMLGGVGHFRSGLPYSMRVSSSIPKEFPSGAAIVGLGPGINGYGGDNRIFGLGSDGVTYNIGRNTYRYPATWKADLRLGKRFDLGGMRQIEILAESFNLFNHSNVTEVETTGYTLEPGSLTGGLPTLNYMSGTKANTTAFGEPLNVNATNFYRERQFQFGARVRF